MIDTSKIHNSPEVYGGVQLAFRQLDRSQHGSMDAETFAARSAESMDDRIQ